MYRVTNNSENSFAYRCFYAANVRLKHRAGARRSEEKKKEEEEESRSRGGEEDGMSAVFIDERAKKRCTMMLEIVHAADQI